MLESIEIGPFIFEYDGKREMYINKGEDLLGMVENVWPEDWEQFISEQIGDLSETSN